MKESDTDIPRTIDCHCLSCAYKYHKRTFINQLNQSVTRVWYKCCNCYSRIHRDYIQAMDEMKTVDVIEYLKTLNK